MNTTDIFAFFAALFSMMNPIGGVGIFASLTADRSEEESRKIAKTCAFASAITLLVVIWAGGGFLQLFGITVNEIRVAGGLIVLLIGLHMLFNKDDHRTSSAETTVHSSHDSIAVVPLAIPLLAGPGTMATVIVASQNHSGISSDFIMSVIVIIVIAITGVLFTY
jgi:multiple antibiotic resistance protein